MPLAQGDVVIATIRPPRGQVQSRPGVVVTPTADLPTAPVVRVVGITTSYRPGDPAVVPIGWRDDGRIHTRLRRDSAAAAGLVNDVPAAEIRPTGGYLSNVELASPLLLLTHLGLA